MVKIQPIQLHTVVYLSFWQPHRIFSDAAAIVVVVAFSLSNFFHRQAENWVFGVNIFVAHFWNTKTQNNQDIFSINHNENAHRIHAHNHGYHILINILFDCEWAFIALETVWLNSQATLQIYGSLNGLTLKQEAVIYSRFILLCLCFIILFRCFFSHSTSHSIIRFVCHCIVCNNQSLSVSLCVCVCARVRVIQPKIRLIDFNSQNKSKSITIV